MLLLDKIGDPGKNPRHHLPPPLDAQFILGQIALIIRAQGIRVRPGVEIDEITRGAFPHLILPFPMDQFPPIKAT